jgi:hypothetical protein
MKLKSVGLIVILAASPCLFAGSEPACSVDGRVLSANDQTQGISGVEITLYRDSTVINTGHSAGDGSYTISCTPGAEITTVRYDHDDWIVDKIENISGQDRNKIYKTLQAKSNPFTSSEMREIVATLERLYDLDKANNTIAKHSSNYSNLLKSLDERAPLGLKDRIRLLRDRYSR